MSRPALLHQLQRIRMLILDVDGTLTDGRIGLDEQQGHLKLFSVKDGISIRSLKEEDLRVGIISHSTHRKSIEARASMLDMSHCYVGKEPKDEVLKKWSQETGLSLEEMAVIGDDVNDLPLFALCGHSACPSDASPKVQEVADLKLAYPGGSGCVREWIEDYLVIARNW